MARTQKDIHTLFGYEIYYGPRRWIRISRRFSRRDVRFSQFHRTKRKTPPTVHPSHDVDSKRSDTWVFAFGTCLFFCCFIPEMHVELASVRATSRHGHGPNRWKEFHQQKNTKTKDTTTVGRFRGEFVHILKPPSRLFVFIIRAGASDIFHTMPGAGPAAWQTGRSRDTVTHRCYWQTDAGR